MSIQSKLSALRQRVTANPVLLLAWSAFAVVAVLNSAKVGVLIWAVCKLAVFAHAGNWVDCRIFPADQPDQLDGIEQGTAWKRKAWLICAAILAGALAP